jgi:hypothetical protein
MNKFGLIVMMLLAAMSTLMAQPQGQSTVTGSEQNQSSQPTLVGCLVSDGEGSGAGFFLTEKKSGTRYRLSGSTAQLKDHLNHLVEVVGKPANTEAGSTAVAARDEAVYEVTGVQDLAPTCSASR